jgi:hypothetical protein
MTEAFQIKTQDVTNNFYIIKAEFQRYQRALNHKFIMQRIYSKT